MPWYEWMYYMAFVVGVVYALVTFILGHFGGGDASGHDVGGHDVGGHGAATSDGSIPHPGGHEVAFSPFSPVVFAMFLASYGGMGVICLKMFEMRNVLAHMPISLAGGIFGGGLTFVFFYKVFATVQGSVLPTTNDIVGTEADVILAIPGHEQLGEIAYVAKGVRSNAPARSEDGTMIPAHTTVVITKIVGATWYVKPVRR
jgi:hypothetical protein